MGTTPGERGYEKSYYQRPYFGDHPGKRRSGDEIVSQLRKAGLAGGSVLDVGAGAGYLMRTFEEAGYEVSGMDFSEAARKLAAQHTSGSVRLGDVCASIPFPSETFDGVILHDVIEHLPDPERALTEVWRVLVPDGRVLISTLNERSIVHTVLGKRWCFYSDPTHVRMYGVESLKTLLRQCGFETVRHWTYFDLNKAGETTTWMKPLRFLACVVYLPARGESLTVVARKLAAEQPETG